MFKLPLLTFVGNAASVLLGSHGDVSRQTRSAGCSRQTAYDHAEQLQQALQDANLPGPSRVELLAQLDQLRVDNESLRQQLAGRIECDRGRRHRLAVTASAMGLSLNQIEEVFAVLLDGQPEDAKAKPAPSRATIGRWVLAACLLAAGVLRVLDNLTRPSARVLCIDEIFFHGKPVLVAVEPHSMAVLLCQKAEDRTGQTWQKELEPFTGMEHAVADAGTGLQAGLRAIQDGRPAEHPLTVSLDVFHLEKDARQTLAWLWRKVEARWAKAEEADARLRAAEQKGLDLRGPLSKAKAAWREVQRYWNWYEHWEAGWGRLKAALQLFRPEGQLNDRGWAEAEVLAACKGLRGPKWAKVRRMATDGRMLAFLDRTKAQLEEAEPRPTVREAVAELCRLEQRGGQATLAQALAQRQVCACLAEDWQRSQERVAKVLAGVVRASSAVECVNSVLRMQQGRHRNVSQEMLDLKRLYWNTRVFRAGKREEACPYEHLGVSLPTYDFWELLQADPGKLSEKLSSSKVAA